MDDELIIEPSPQAEAADSALPDDSALELEGLRVALESRETDLAAARQANRLAVERLRTAMTTIEPALTPEMLGGDTVEELEASFTTAMDTPARLRERVRREQMLPVGAGAPGRTGVGPTTALEKIRDGLARGSRG